MIIRSTVCDNSGVFSQAPTRGSVGALSPFLNVEDLRRHGAGLHQTEEAEFQGTIEVENGTSHSCGQLRMRLM